MFNLLKNKETVLKEKLQRILEIPNKQKKNVTEPIKTIGILTENEIWQKFHFQKLVEETFGIKNVKLFCFDKLKKENPNPNQYFIEKEILKNGAIKNYALQNFLEEPFDLLICFLDENNLFVEFATAKSNAVFKVGFASINTSLFDLEIAVKFEMLDKFLSELKKYLIILKKIKMDKK